MADARTCSALWGFSDLLRDAEALLEEFNIVGRDALVALGHLVNTASRFRYLRTPPMPQKPEGTRFRTPKPPTEAELRNAGLSEGLLPEFVKAIESAKAADPQSAGARSLLAQIRDQGATERQSSVVRHALGALEALTNLSSFQ